jgi:hypothetical protein
MIITLEDLKAKGACSSQVALFGATFGDHVGVTKGLLLKWCHQFDLRWVAIQYLTEERRKAYDEAVAPARKAYDKAVATALKAYDKAVATALKAYDEAVATAWRAFEEAVASAQKAYEEAVAVALWEQIKDMK